MDARQPHELEDPASLQGIDTIRVATLHEASPCCWSLHETRIRGGANAITDVREVDDLVYEIELARPITPGGVTSIYHRGNAPPGVFTAHPANVDGDEAASAADVLALIDCCLNETCDPPWGIYSCDIDHSGGATAYDILALINLLNGASEFDAWLGTPLPTPAN